MHDDLALADHQLQLVGAVVRDVRDHRLVRAAGSATRCGRRGAGDQADGAGGDCPAPVTARNFLRFVSLMVCPPGDLCSTM